MRARAVAGWADDDSESDDDDMDLITALIRCLGRGPTGPDAPADVPLQHCIFPCGVPVTLSSTRWFDDSSGVDSNHAHSARARPAYSAARCGCAAAPYAAASCAAACTASSAVIAFFRGSTSG